MPAVAGWDTASTRSTAPSVTTCIGRPATGSRKPEVTFAMPTSARRTSCAVFRPRRSVHGARMYASKSRSPISSSNAAKRRVANHWSRTESPDLVTISRQAKRMTHTKLD